MSRSVAVRLLLAGMLIPFLFTGCKRDPNVLKQKYLESGNRYRDKGKLREAVIEYSNAIQVDSRFAEAHYQLGETYLKLRDYQRAFAELSRTVDLAPDNYPAHTELASLLIAGAHNPDGSRNQNYDDYMKQARNHLDTLREKQPDSPGTHVAWANYYAAQDKPGSALEEMQKAVAADPSRPEFYLGLASMQDRANLPDQAENNFRKAITLAPQSVNAQVALGFFLAKRNRMADAEQQFRQAISLSPKDPAPRTALVETLMAEGKKAEIEAFLQQTKKDLADNSEGYRMLGNYYYQVLGDLDKATTEYASLYSEHPKDPDVKRNYVQLLILKSRLDEAAKLNNELLKANPKDTDALVYRGQIQIQRNDAAGAVDSLQQALKIDSNSAVAHYWLGRAFDLQHNEAQAESEWREAVRLRPDLTNAQNALGLLELGRGDLDAANGTAQQIIHFAPNSPDGYAVRASIEMARRRYSDAEQDMQKAATLAPKSPLPYLQMGNLHLLQKQYSEALKSFQRALDLDSGSVEALAGVMTVYLDEKHPDQAVAAAKTQIGKSPNSSGSYDLLGKALLQEKDLGGAETAFRKALELDSNNADALYQLVKVQRAQGSGSVSQALAIDLQSIKAHPREIAFYLLAGMMYEDDSQKKWDEAKTMYQQVLSLDPENALASNNLAYLMLQHGGNVDVALAMAQTARRGMPDSPQAADTLGWAYFQKGVYRSAIDMFQESLRLNEKAGAADDPSVHYHLGLAYQKANQPAQARQQLERALKIDPNNSDVRKALSELRG